MVGRGRAFDINLGSSIVKPRQRYSDLYVSKREEEKEIVERVIDDLAKSYIQ